MLALARVKQASYLYDSSTLVSSHLCSWWKTSIYIQIQLKRRVSSVSNGGSTLSTLPDYRQCVRLSITVIGLCFLWLHSQNQCAVILHVHWLRFESTPFLRYVFLCLLVLLFFFLNTILVLITLNLEFEVCLRNFIQVKYLIFST